MNKYEAFCSWILYQFQNQIANNMELAVSVQNFKKKKRESFFFQTKEKYLRVIN